MKSWRTAATLILTTPSSNTRAICGRKKIVHGCFSTNYAVLMLQRSSKNNFFPNAYVFPGGGLDHADVTSKWLELFDNIDGGFVKHLDRLRLDPSMRTTSPMMLCDAASSPDNLPPDISYRICAIRETFEETGLLLARTKVPSDEYMLGKKTLYARTFKFEDSDMAKHWRKKVTKDAKNFLKLCHHFKCVPDIWCLHEWSNWLTPICKGMKPTKRYDTIFYKAAIQSLPEYLVQDNEEISGLEICSAHESDRVFRKNPESFLEDYFNEECQVGNPQIYELLRLVNMSDHEDLITFFVNRGKEGLERYLPLLAVSLDSYPVALYPGDEDYQFGFFQTEETLPLQLNCTSHEMLHDFKDKKYNRVITGKGKRGEIKDKNIVCNIEMPFGHLSPADNRLLFALDSSKL